MGQTIVAETKLGEELNVGTIVRVITSHEDKWDAFKELVESIMKRKEADERA